MARIKLDSANRLYDSRCIEQHSEQLVIDVEPGDLDPASSADVATSDSFFWCCNCEERIDEPKLS